MRKGRLFAPGLRLTKRILRACLMSRLLTSWLSVSFICLLRGEPGIATMVELDLELNPNGQEVRNEPGNA